MTGFVSCPIHVRSANLGMLTALVDLRTGQVDTLLGWAHHAWLALARTGDTAIAATAIDGTSAHQAIGSVRQLQADRLLEISPQPRPWTVPRAPAAIPSWGTQEVPAGVVPPSRTAIGTMILAGIALSGVLFARHVGQRSRSFSRIVALLTATTRWPRRGAEPTSVEHALHSVRNVASVLPFRVAYLEETAAAMLVLAAQGWRAGWRHGIAADPNPVSRVDSRRWTPRRRTCQHHPVRAAAAHPLTGDRMRWSGGHP
jgi:Transglutaminase-like superfamily